MGILSIRHHRPCPRGSTDERRDTDVVVIRPGKPFGDRGDDATHHCSREWKLRERRRTDRRRERTGDTSLERLAIRGTMSSPAHADERRHRVADCGRPRRGDRRREWQHHDGERHREEEPGRTGERVRLVRAQQRREERGESRRGRGRSAAQQLDDERDREQSGERPCGDALRDAEREGRGNGGTGEVDALARELAAPAARGGDGVVAQSPSAGGRAGPATGTRPLPPSSGGSVRIPTGR